MNMQMNVQEGASLLREIFFEKLESNPTINTGECVALFEKCTSIKSMTDVWHRQAVCVKMMKAYPDGHPAQSGWLNEFVALGHYEEHLNDLEVYRAELAVDKTAPTCL